MTGNIFREHPLVLYVFSQQKNMQNLFNEQTRSGSICINDTIMFYGGKIIGWRGIVPSLRKAAILKKINNSKFKSKIRMILWTQLKQNCHLFESKKASLARPETGHIGIGWRLMEIELCHCNIATLTINKDDKLVTVIRCGDGRYYLYIMCYDNMTTAWMSVCILIASDNW